MSFDAAWYRDVNGVAPDTPWANDVLAAYALWGGLALLALLLVVGWLLARRRADAPRAVAVACCCGLGAVVALVVNQQLISPAVARTRPCHVVAHAHPLLTCPNDFSFPSDHCMIAGAFAAGLLMLNRRLGAFAVLLALLLAFTRVYAGVHYPTDVAAGLAIGAAIGVIVVTALRRPLTALAAWVMRTPLRPLVATRPPRAT